MASMVALAPADPGQPACPVLPACVFRRAVAPLRWRIRPGPDSPAADAEMTPPAGLFLVASLYGEPVGCGALKFRGDGPADIKRMWVSPSVRGLGLGRRILAELEADARARGARLVRLETNRTLTEAIALYRTSGYREVPAFNAEPYAHHWFEKKLGSSSRTWPSVPTRVPYAGAVATNTPSRDADSRSVPAAMRRDVRLLGEILGQVISDSGGQDLLDDVEDLRHRVIAARQLEAAAADGEQAQAGRRRHRGACRQLAAAARRGRRPCLHGLLPPGQPGRGAPANPHAARARHWRGARARVARGRHGESRRDARRRPAR